MKQAILGIACLSLLAGCMEKDLYKAPEVKPADAYFDFSTSTSCTVDLNYGFKNYQVVFELYAENPLSADADGNMIKTTEEPIYRGATNKDGVFNEDISIPSYITEVYLYSDYLKTISPIKLKVENGKISFDQKAFIQNNKNTRGMTRSTAENGYEYPNGYQILGTWNEIGRPNYISSFSTAEIDPQLLYDIRKVFIEPGGGSAIIKTYPQYLANNINIEINIKKPTKIALVMLSTTASKQNTMGYFTYPTNQKPTSISSDITPIIAFPRISTTICNSPSTAGGMYAGDRVELKYWDGNKFVEEFPAGVSIAWFLMDSSYDSTNHKVVANPNNRIFYSIRDLNKSKEHRTIALKDESGQVVAFGMEDAHTVKDDIEEGNFGDAVFYLDFSDGKAIETGGVENLPNAPLENTALYTSYSGVLSFEDSWPLKGDYDMNDMIVEYNRKVFKNVLTGKVNKIEDTFIPKHNGASYENGFGYQLTGIPSSDIKDIKIESNGITSKYMEGRTSEAGQNYPTIILYDNQKAVLGKTFKVTLTITPEKYSEQAFTPFFDNKFWNQAYKFNMNPFIIINSNIGREKEAHIVKFPPTQKMDTSLFGTSFDASRIDDGLYYVNNDNMPTGLQITGVSIGTKKGTNFMIPVETTSILEAYPQFGNWASSFGAEYSRWWTNPKKENVIQ